MGPRVACIRAMVGYFHRSVSFPPAGASRMLSDIVIVINLKKVKI